MPRAANTTLRISRYLVRGLWYLWPRAATLLFAAGSEQKEDFFATYAPFYLIVLLCAWVAALLGGWALVFYGLRAGLQPQGLDFGDTLYYAGASLLTIGYGDIVAHSMTTRLLSLLCAASGLAVVAVVISFLFSIFGAFQTREQFVVTLGARAGVPPSGVGLLETLSYAGLREDLAQTLREGQVWAAAVMETHLAYPTLMYFRSSHDYQSWVGTLGTLLDASALVISTIEPEHVLSPQSRGQALLMYEIGKHLTNDFAHYFDLMHGEPAGPGIEEQEFAAAVERLENAGYVTRDAAGAWSEFTRLRTRYGLQLNALARRLEIPPVQWVGDRSLLHAPPHGAAH
ncbi:MAG: potassium channel family protein [Candidatus Baltobacteraceae bacterium]